MKTLDFVAGLTVFEALSKACNVAKNTGKPVLADINDVVMIVNKDTNLQKTVKEYREKLQFKYEIEKIKSEKKR